MIYIENIHLASNCALSQTAENIIAMAFPVNYTTHKDPPPKTVRKKSTCRRPIHSETAQCHNGYVFTSACSCSFHTFTERRRTYGTLLLQASWFLKWESSACLASKSNEHDTHLEKGVTRIQLFTLNHMFNFHAKMKVSS